MGVMEITKEGIVLTELHPDYTVEEIRDATEAELIISEDLKPIDRNSEASGV
jgi:acetate CoA/acetoacetate CoA-transferase beta subunit